MDLSFLTEYYVPIVLTGCLCVGYCIKNISWLSRISNEYIPTIMLFLGAALCCISKQQASLEIMITGAVTGLASTGLHQAFTQIIGKAGGKVE